MSVNAAAACDRECLRDAKVLFVLRLKIENDEISEIETVVTRPSEGFLGGRFRVVWEAFKVYGGQIHAVEAFMETVPLGTPSGWD